ncbi:AcrR family transcriptional regulator [Kitasatospora gansuensis]|uniref:AcrR family transcriptional regulator n=1 Tax=Kitasatospora gansuensis TaxID=258050 RepID=A0A7W7WGN6_9ACTN|nr:TetR/AcrR family transcriptional regulator [Kitasatospora gansuensis]MBB4945810.1 AcrR family transcriptional regulator [Kitasatospora gansuensis]
MEKERRRLGPDDWAEAALTALGEGGLAAVAVEPVAARLGATKGSFYWHFTNRDALIGAALALWEERFTEATIAPLAAEPDPRTRLRRLFATVSAKAGQNAVTAHVVAAADHPAVGPVVRRVLQRRIDYVAGLFEEIGFPPAVALQRSVLAYTVYVGHDQLAARLPGLLPLGEGEQLADHLDAFLALLLTDAPDRP